ncbi:MAG: phosphate/phosphite/phosphonate ABC transporter substrate-binding protein [Gammaproteobacteria bacterium]|nr:phosphate/phosphite/phosphonate ABC transporter substrate-binding protein [Gammaproteobacteria bacterium]
MHKWKAIIWTILAAAGTAIAGNEGDGTYVIGVVPQFEASKLHAVWRPILDQVELKTGYKFKLRGSPSIPEFEREFIRGSFDFAYMNPYHLVMANKLAGYIPIVRDRGRMLYGVLVVRKESDISSPSQLNGKSVAFPSPNALGASLQMRQELHDKFGVKTTPVYVKTHDSVYLNVLLGEVDAGGGVQKTLNRQKPAYRDALRVIYTTTKVNPHPIAALPSVPQEVRDAVQQAFVDLGKTEEGKKLLAKIPMKEVGPASVDDYQPLKEMGLERFAVTTE